MLFVPWKLQFLLEIGCTNFRGSKGRNCSQQRSPQRIFVFPLLSSMTLEVN